MRSPDSHGAIECETGAWMRMIEEASAIDAWNVLARNEDGRVEDTSKTGRGGVV